MLKNKKQLVYVLVAVTIASTLLAYFGRPKPPLLVLDTPREEYAQYNEGYPGDTHLSDKLVKSYGLAMVLVKSPYTEKNVVALDTLRSWSRTRFQQQPDFLHPVSLPSTDETHRTFVDDFFNNIFAGMHYWLQEQAGEFLRTRIAAFHDSRAYQSFHNAYFGLFGVDSDTVALLAAYQSEKAKLAVDVLLWTVFWTIAIVFVVYKILSTKPSNRYETMQRVLANAWILVALSYLCLAYAENEISFLVSSTVSLVIGLYLRKSFILVPGTQLLFRIRFTKLPSNWVVLATWLSFSIFVMQSLTWIRTGTLANPDPITLLIASFSGNFLQDQIHTKRTITVILGLAWLALGAWTTTQMTGDAKIAMEEEEKLASLHGPG